LASQIVMDHTGDSRHWFDPANPEGVAEAEARFEKLTGAGFTAAKRLGQCKSQILRRFDATAEETVFIPGSKLILRGCTRPKRPRNRGARPWGNPSRNPRNGQVPRPRGPPMLAWLRYHRVQRLRHANLASALLHDDGPGRLRNRSTTPPRCIRMYEEDRRTNRRSGIGTGPGRRSLARQLGRRTGAAPRLVGRSKRTVRTPTEGRPIKKGPHFRRALKSGISS
jgi:hypothetical protein